MSLSGNISPSIFDFYLYECKIYSYQLCLSRILPPNPRCDSFPEALVTLRNTARNVKDLGALAKASDAVSSSIALCVVWNRFSRSTSPLLMSLKSRPRPCSRPRSCGHYHHHSHYHRHRKNNLEPYPYPYPCHHAYPLALAPAPAPARYLHLHLHLHLHLTLSQPKQASSFTFDEITRQAFDDLRQRDGGEGGGGGGDGNNGEGVEQSEQVGPMAMFKGLWG
jgi:hypothetical protein